MADLEQQVIEHPIYTRLEKVVTQTAVATDDILKRVESNYLRPHTRLEELPEFMKVKGANTPICLVGGGPTVKGFVDEIKSYRTIMVAGSANDWCMENGIVPTYTVVCDPDRVMANYLTKTHPETKYLVATSCDEAVFKALEGRQIVMWHCHSDEMGEKMKALEEKRNRTYNAVGGGCTVGLRSISIAILMGYTNHQLYGYDSCLGEKAEEHHAYEFTEESEREAGVGQVYDIKVGPLGEEPPPDAIPFRCAGYQLAQAHQFLDFRHTYGKVFTPTFHGRSLLGEIQKYMHQMENKQLESV